MKNFFCRNMLTLITIGVLVTALIVPIVAQTYFVGDLNNDSKLNAVDASLLNATLTGTKELQTINVENGKSAYELAVQSGYTGTLTEWLESLKGEKGDKGDQGVDGKSAYELYCEAYPEYTGTMEEWLDALKGEKGETGRGIENVALNDSGDIVFSYTDETSSTIGNINSLYSSKYDYRLTYTYEYTNPIRIKVSANDAYKPLITEINIPAEINGYKVVLAENAFQECRALEKVILSEGITDIPEKCFFGCVRLSEISIPETVKTIGMYAFDGTTSLKTVVFPMALNNIYPRAFSYSGIENAVFSNTSKGYLCFMTGTDVSKASNLTALTETELKDAQYMAEQLKRLDNGFNSSYGIAFYVNR